MVCSVFVSSSSRLALVLLHLGSVGCCPAPCLVQHVGCRPGIASLYHSSTRDPIPRGPCMQKGLGGIRPAAGLHPKGSPIAVEAPLCTAAHRCAGLCSRCSSRGVARGPRCARASHRVHSRARRHSPHSAKGAPLEKYHSGETTGMLLGAGCEFLMPRTVVLGGSSASQSGAAGPHRLVLGLRGRGEGWRCRAERAAPRGWEGAS